MEQETPARLDPWLSHFPALAQPLVTAWFAYAASQGAQTPDALLTIVERVVSHKLDWSTTLQTRHTCQMTLLALCHQRAGARAYAATLLPPQARV
jgi:hypothetical protein